MTRHIVPLVAVLSLLCFAGSPATEPQNALVLENPLYACWAFKEQGEGSFTDEHRIAILKELGYAGYMGGPIEHPEKYKTAGLELIGFYFGVSPVKETLETTVTRLEARKAMISRDVGAVWLYLVDEPSHKDEAKAVQRIQDVVDYCHKQGLRVALYPHSGQKYYFPTSRDAVKYVKLAGRDKLGIVLTLYHEILAGYADVMETTVKEVLPYTHYLQICGAYLEPKQGVKRLTTMDRGDFDALPILRIVLEAGYKGPIGFYTQWFGGTTKDNLSRQLSAWKKYNQRLQKGYTSGTANPTKPFSVVSVLYHYEALDGAHDVQLSGDLAFVPGKGVKGVSVPGKGGSLAIINIANPQKPEILWFLHADSLEDAETVLPVDGHLLLGTRDFFSLDISEPSEPVFMKKVANREDSRIDSINGMVKRGDYVLAANKRGWIDVFDVSDLTFPRLFGALHVQKKYSLRGPHDIDLFGDYIVLVMPNGFGEKSTGEVAVIRIADPSTHEMLPLDQWCLASVTASQKLIGANRVQISGSFAYVGGSWAPQFRRKHDSNVRAHLSVVDLSDAAKPRVVASLPFPDTRGPNGLTVVGNVVFLAGGQTVQAVDVSDPLHPVEIGAQRFPLA
ncbi:MAG TPA: TIM barrel protein, partial [Sedimentisphaerales bacterium]|nr:TIM barrel protein [Sedimentisphaerales bacterium]